MTYSVDLRQKVVAYIENGGKITAASKIFNVGKTSIYRWLNSPSLEPQKITTRSRKIDKSALRKDVEENPDITLKARAEKFNVAPSSICRALKKMNITRKKKQFRYKERDRQERMEYYRKLRELIMIFGSACLIYIDEAGFEESVECPYAYAERGKKIYGEKQGKRGKRENLVAARRNKVKDFIAPMIFSGSLNAEGFEGWLEYYLLPSLKELKESPILIMDNAPIHRKTRIRELVEACGYAVIFLPRYSPDLNDIEHDFAAIKKLRAYDMTGKTLDEIIKDYCVA